MTGERDTLTRTLAEHHDVAALRYFGSERGSAAVEALSSSNLKATWVSGGKRHDWLSPVQGQGRGYLRHATQVKTVWVPYGI